MVIDSRQIRGEQHDHLWDLQVVHGVLTDAFDAPHGVVAEEAHHAAGQRRQVGQPFARRSSRV